ncbi:MAG: segregation/condensation protein A [Pelobium sp.]
MSSVEDFSIKLPIFEGPFDLLLFFIEKDELDIHNIPIAKITDDFLNYIHQLNALNIELASEFIFVAATLMRIKAKMLLPRPELNEDGDEIDLKGDLIRRLIEYKRFKQITEDFKALEEARFVKEKRGNIQEDINQLLSNNDSLEDYTSLNLFKLLKTYQRIMKNYLVRTEEIKHTVEKYPYSIEEQKQQIGNLLRINSQIDFKNLAKMSKDKVQFVYNFLAVLEMLQQQLINIQIGLGYNNFRIEQNREGAQ